MPAILRLFRGDSCIQSFALPDGPMMFTWDAEYPVEFDALSVESTGQWAPAEGPPETVADHARAILALVEPEPEWED